MKGHCIVFFVLILFFLPDSLFSQASITVTKPRLEVSGNNLTIQYDILNTRSSDFFIVWLDVTDAAGNNIKALSITGDVGDKVKGGKNKKITWNFINDSLYIDEDLYVTVNAEKIAAKEETAEIKTKEETKTTEETKIRENAGDNIQLTEKNEIGEDKETPENKKETELKEESRTPIKEEGTKEISKGKMVLTSAVLPGWGQTKFKNGKPFWLIGAVGYSCIAGSIFMNRSASSAYDDYRVSIDPDESNTLFDKAMKRNNLSKALGYSAIGIWAADIIWVLVTPVKTKMSADLKKEMRLKIVPAYDACSNVGIITLTYSF
jgi:hypothetical protein